LSSHAPVPEQSPKRRERSFGFVTTCVSVIALAACAGQGIPNTPATTPALVGPSLSKAQNTVDSHSFSAAAGKQLNSDADYEKYIDPQIVGADRKKALRFMKMMPANWRGDFTYVYANHKVLSNRLSVARGIVFHKIHLPSTKVRPNVISPNFIPPLNDSTGPFIREYSTSGGSAMMGFATIGCNNTDLNPGDGAFMYGGVFASNGQNYDAGLEWFNDQKINPFTTPYQNDGWSNPGTAYHCDQHIAVFTGVLGGNTAVIITGIPDEDPTQVQLPPSMVHLTSPAWNFFPLPSNAWNNCSGCVAKRMTTIALGRNNEYGSDTSCFGGCNGTTTNWWDQIVMGQLISPCNQTPNVSFECTIQYLTDGSWYGGIQNETETGAATYHNETVNQYEEGIDLWETSPLKKSGPFHHYATPGPLPTPSIMPCSAPYQGSGNATSPNALCTPCPDITGPGCPQAQPSNSSTGAARRVVKHGSEE
jgi:hypothetical protein